MGDVVERVSSPLPGPVPLRVSASWLSKQQSVLLCACYSSATIIAAAV